MGEFTEVRTTIDGHERAAELAHAILTAGLATSIDIAEVPVPHRAEPAWQLTLVTTARELPLLERHIKETGADLVSEPVDLP
ncbi:hypothetical protein E1286_39935 [Nonomuraea terrae]|uniref:ACT domain-containing protein n=1 Tax=Nonomuraea terrae TaxID=2530383 RepID=A0A4V2YIJ8_9ACTN|nr:hypothetical protein [Nonomuraea terrae]TDD35187.1 hypothetical protein E1286_39935 [Nonomuraea terrae]